MGVVAADGRWLRVNRAVCELSGASEETLLRSSLQDLVDIETGEGSDVAVATVLEREGTADQPSRRRFTRANGERGAALVTVSRLPAKNGEPQEFIAQIEDISELAQASERLAGAAPNDALTGLPGRRTFVRDVAMQIERCRRNDEKAALLLVEVDDFVAFTAAHGRPAGDAALVAVADALRGRLRRTDVVARLGDHQFAVLLPRDKDAVHVAQALQQLAASLHVPIGGEAHLTATVGVRVIDPSSLAAEVVLDELEHLTANEHPASARIGYPSRAATSATGLRGMQWIRTRLGIGAVVLAAAGGIAYAIHEIVSHPVTVPRPVRIQTAVVAVSGQNIGVSATGAFSVRLRCAGAICRGVLGLTSAVPSGATRGTRRRTRTAILADARFVIPLGSSTAVPGRLNGEGRSLFAADKGYVSADVAATLNGATGYSPALRIHLVHAVLNAPAPSPRTPGLTPGSATPPVGSATGPDPAPTPLPTPGVSGSGSIGDLPAVPSGPCVLVDVAPGATSAAQSLATTLCLINAQRTMAGLPPLVENTLLDQAGTAHNNDMIANDYFAHVSPAGKTVLDWITASGFLLAENGYVIGENIAWGTYTLATPQAIVTAWMNSPDHRANILDPSYTDTGIAIAPQVPASLGLGQPGALYTENFAGITG